MEIRSPDPSCNQYAALALILAAGFEGIGKNLKLMPEMTINTYKADVNELKDLQTLPQSLPEAIRLAKASDFVKKVLPEVTLNAFVEAENI